jgi:hypothetical protein
MSSQRGAMIIRLYRSVNWRRTVRVVLAQGVALNLGIKSYLTFRVMACHRRHGVSSESRLLTQLSHSVMARPG